MDGFSIFRAYPSPCGRWRRTLGLEGLAQDVPADAAEEPGRAGGRRSASRCLRTGSRSRSFSLPGSGGWHASACASGCFPWVIPPCGVGQWISGMLGPFAGSPTPLPVYYHKGNIIVKLFLHRLSPFTHMPLPAHSGSGEVLMDGVRREVRIRPSECQPSSVAYSFLNSITIEFLFHSSNTSGNR